MAPSAKPPLALRWVGLFWGIVTFFWLPIEDTNLTLITILTLGWSAWLGVWLAWRGALAGRENRLVWLGGAAGGLSLPLAFIFMLIKAGLHGHGSLDFSWYQIGQLASYTPLWAALGAAVGLGVEHFSKPRE